MRIQHNISAINSHRNLMGNNSAVGKNLEKLSSGYRINRAGDDAAGLAISEKMRAQITGLQTAQKNAEDGVSLVQTAEGALTEVHSMLNRMVELATQAANGTYSSTNRAQMQKEVKALQDEIKRIGNTANFNGTTLFGNFSDNIGKTGTKTDGYKQTVNIMKITLHVGESSTTHNQITITLRELKSCVAGALAISIGSSVSWTPTTGATIKGGSLTTGAGAAAKNFATAARAAIKVINADIDNISALRADFGALQNRLEHTINNIGVQTENITAAESRIRDVDMAKEMMAYTKNNILVQASQAMLAQANQQPQGVLQLLG